MRRDRLPWKYPLSSSPYAVLVDFALTRETYTLAPASATRVSRGRASGAADGPVERPRDAELRCKGRPQRQRSDAREAGNPDRACDDVSFRDGPFTPAKPPRDAWSQPAVKHRPHDETEDQHHGDEHLGDKRGPELGELKEGEEVPLRLRNDHRARIGRLSWLEQRPSDQRHQTKSDQDRHRENRVRPDVIGKVGMSLAFGHVLADLVADGAEHEANQRVENEHRIEGVPPRDVQPARACTGPVHAGSAGPCLRMSRKWT